MSVPPPWNPRPTLQPLTPPHTPLPPPTMCGQLSQPRPLQCNDTSDCPASAWPSLGRSSDLFPRNWGWGVGMAAIRSGQTGAWPKVRVVSFSAVGPQIFAGLGECSLVQCTVTLCSPLRRRSRICATRPPAEPLSRHRCFRPHPEVPSSGGTPSFWRARRRACRKRRSTASSPGDAAAGSAWATAGPEGG